MASTQVTPTRMELTRTKKKLVTAIKSEHGTSGKGRSGDSFS